MPVRLIDLKRITDSRGWFYESYSRETLRRHGVDIEFVQDNHSLSSAPGVLRGLHFQRPPHAQAKLVRCIRGRVWDAVVDLRAGSPTFGAAVTCELSAAQPQLLFIPIGFAHGFISLEAGTEVEYKVSSHYAPGFEVGVAWNDPTLAIAWPASVGAPILSEKDAGLPLLADIEIPFQFDGSPLGPIFP